MPLIWSCKTYIVKYVVSLASFSCDCALNDMVAPNHGTCISINQLYTRKYDVNLNKIQPLII